VGWTALFRLVLTERSVNVSSVESCGALDSSEVRPEPVELAEYCGDDAGVVCTSNSLISARANNVVLLAFSAGIV
jgi:hypothetical protein